MHYTPKSEREILEDGLWPDGIYDAEVFDATDKISKSGNEMIELVLDIFDNAGRKRQVRDWLMESMMWKLRSACEAMGMIELYDRGEISSSDFMGRTCRIKLGRNVDKTGNYPDSNGIKGYVAEKTGMVRSKVDPRYGERARRATDASVDLDDEIPF